MTCSSINAEATTDVRCEYALIRSLFTMHTCALQGCSVTFWIKYTIFWYLPPAYVVRREGNVLTRVCPSICLSTGGGYPYPIMLCNITQNAMGQTPGGYPYPIMLCNISQNAMGQTPRGVPCQVQLGGYPARSSQGGVPCQGVSCWGVPR